MAVNIQKGSDVITINKRNDGKYVLYNLSDIYDFKFTDSWRKNKFNKKFLKKLKHNNSAILVKDCVHGTFELKAQSTRVLNKKNYKNLIKKLKKYYVITKENNTDTIILREDVQ